MLLLQKDNPVLKISENGSCQILDFGRLPFALRWEGVTFPEFVEWASNRAFSPGRNLMSQTSERDMTLKDSALAARRELKIELSGIFSMERPDFLEEHKWEQVLGRCRELEDAAGV